MWILRFQAEGGPPGWPLRGVGASRSDLEDRGSDFTGFDPTVRASGRHLQSPARECGVIKQKEPGVRQDGIDSTSQLRDSLEHPITTHSRFGQHTLGIWNYLVFVQNGPTL